MKKVSVRMMALLCSLMLLGGCASAPAETESKAAETAAGQTESSAVETEEVQTESRAVETAASEMESSAVETEPVQAEKPAAGSETTAAENGEWDTIDFGDEQYYAVAYLGYDDLGNLQTYTDQYLDGEKPPVQYISPGDYYLIIPRYADMAVALYQNDMETSGTELIYESDNGEPFVLQCNVSDIFADATIRLTYQGESFEFTPFISLKDGSLDVRANGLDITMKLQETEPEANVDWPVSCMHAALSEAERGEG